MFPGKVPAADSILIFWDENQILFPNLKSKRFTGEQESKFSGSVETKKLGLSENGGENYQFQWLKWIQTPLSSYFHAALGGIPAEVAEVSSIWAHACSF